MVVSFEFEIVNLRTMYHEGKGGARAIWINLCVVAIRVLEGLAIFGESVHT